MFGYMGVFFIRYKQTIYMLKKRYVLTFIGDLVAILNTIFCLRCSVF